ncbi:MAG TPA: lysophospholipid acyltransferase family protein [Burkholderiales bacterium]|jgi:1-acyl-sn-glycerol-3-phosphate acyltransferase
MHTPYATRLLRITRLALHLVRGLATAAFVFPFQTPQARNNTIRRWSARLLTGLAVRLHVHGRPHSEAPLMLVANHVSWLDIFAINSVLPARFVAKSEIRHWPLLGWLAERSGTLFIERARRRDTARINTEVSAALLAGDVFAVFPEGTTTDGSTVLKFHSALLAPAVTADAAVQPVAIRFERADGSLCVEAAYDGDKSFWDALRGMTTQRAIDAHVWFLSSVSHAQQHRRNVATDVRNAIVLTLSPEALRNRTVRGADLRA